MNAPRQYGADARAAQAGFTLLELLVAMALLGLIAALLVSGLQLGTASRDRLAQSSSGLEDLRVVDRFLRGRLETVLPYVSGRRGDLATVRFVGDERSLRFLAASVFRDETRGIRALRVALDGPSNRKSLVVHDAPWTGDTETVDSETGGSPAERYVLVEALAEATFSYYGANPAHSEPSWHRQWRNASALPDLIRIDLVPGDTNRPWPPITVAPVLARADR